MGGEPPPAPLSRAFDAQADVRLLEAAARLQLDVLVGVGLPARVVGFAAPAVAPRGPAAKEPVQGFEDLELADVPCDRDDQIVRGVALTVIPIEVAEPDRGDCLRRTEDRLAERMRSPERSDEHLVDEVIRVVVRLAELFQDHAPLDLDVVGLESGRQHDISQQVHGFREARVEGVRVEAGVLLGRECVDVPPEAIDRTGDLDRRTPAGPLEQDVLQEVRDAPLAGRLFARPGPDEEAQRERADVLHLVDEDGHSVIEKVFADHRWRPAGGHILSPGARGYPRSILII